MGQERTDKRGAVLEKKQPKAEHPRLYRVILHNDDYTPMDFVEAILETIFDRSPAEAHRVMMQVHQRGSGVAGVYSHEIAETKVALVHEEAEADGYPLRASAEPD